MLLTHAVPCIFLGIMYAQFYDWLLRSPDIQDALRREVKYGVMLVINGLTVAGTVRVYQLLKRGFEGDVTLALYRMPLNFKGQLGAVGTAFLCGCTGLSMLFNEWGLVALTVVTIAVAVLHWRHFLNAIVEMLRPRHYVSWLDVHMLFYIYTMMLFCFSLINASLEMLHYLLKLHPAFNFGGETTPMVFDAFYFTVVVVSTLGFGDIYPLSADAKLVIMIQSLSSYGMFALIVGVVTRGIVSRDEHAAEIVSIDVEGLDMNSED